jgi:hypothetical protein
MAAALRLMIAGLPNADLLYVNIHYAEVAAHPKLCASINVKGYHLPAASFPSDTNPGDLLLLVASFLERECRRRGHAGQALIFQVTFAELVNTSLANALVEVAHDGNRRTKLRDVSAYGQLALEVAPMFSRLLQAPSSVQILSLSARSLPGITDALSLPCSLECVHVEHHRHTLDVASFARASGVPTLSADCWQEAVTQGPIPAMPNLLNLSIALLHRDLEPFLAACPNLLSLAVQNIAMGYPLSPLLEQISKLTRLNGLHLAFRDGGQIVREALPFLARMRTVKRLVITTSFYMSEDILDLIIWTMPGLWHLE